MKLFLITVTFILISKLIPMFVGYIVLLLSRQILFLFLADSNCRKFRILKILKLYSQWTNAMKIFLKIKI